MSRVVHFEINSAQPEKAAEWYEEVFGWTIQKRWTGEQDYWLIRTGMSDTAGINGGIKEKTTPSAAMVPQIEVDSVDTASERIAATGGKLLSPKITIPQTGYLMYCQDPEGIPFSIIQKDSTTK